MAVLSWSDDEDCVDQIMAADFTFLRIDIARAFSDDFHRNCWGQDAPAIGRERLAVA